jgi:predicted nucleotidyltransferase component of viral defense system
MKVPELENFYLVGGTTLSLMYGHRKSVDIDLFSIVSFQNDQLISILESNFKNFSYRNSNNPIGLFCMIGNIKVDFVKHHIHPLIDQPLFIDGIRLFSTREIMAMKIAAILKRGVKKDFWDISELLKHYSVQECITAYSQKYPSQQLLISIPNVLTYFVDADESEEPVSLKGQTWESVKKSIQQKVNAFLK